MSNETFAVNHPTVVSEIFDDEVVIIHMDTGVYYSLQGSAGIIWQLLESGSSAALLVEQVAAAFSVPQETVQSGVEEFVAALQAEDLIRPSDAMPGRQEVTLLEPAGYAPPGLMKYEDLQDLLLVDPIHEVDEDEGWPNAAPQSGRE